MWRYCYLLVLFLFFNLFILLFSFYYCRACSFRQSPFLLDPNCHLINKDIRCLLNFSLCVLRFCKSSESNSTKCSTWLILAWYWLFFAVLGSPGAGGVVGVGGVGGSRWWCWWCWRSWWRCWVVFGGVLGGVVGGVVGGITLVLLSSVSSGNLVVTTYFTFFIHHDTNGRNHLIVNNARICTTNFFYMVEVSSFFTTFELKIWEGNPTSRIILHSFDHIAFFVRLSERGWIHQLSMCVLPIS